MSRRFDGRVCVLAGAATGIGPATARRLVDEGAHVVVGDMNADNGNALVKHAARVMRIQTWGGVIINTGSIAGLDAGVPPPRTPLRRLQ